MVLKIAGIAALLPLLAGDADFPPLRVPTETQQPMVYNDVMRGKPVRIVALKVRVESAQAAIHRARQP